MTYRVEIIECLKQFHRAHEALINSLGGANHIARSTALDLENRFTNHWEIIKHNWQKQYHATPVTENGHWKWLDFESEQQYTIFLLRWS